MRVCEWNHNQVYQSELKKGQEKPGGENKESFFCEAKGEKESRHIQRQKKEAEEILTSLPSIILVADTKTALQIPNLKAQALYNPFLLHVGENLWFKEKLTPIRLGDMGKLTLKKERDYSDWV